MATKPNKVKKVKTPKTTKKVNKAIDVDHIWEAGTSPQTETVVGESTTPIDNPGSYMPAFSHRWTIHTSLPDAMDSVLRKNVVRCSLSLVNFTFSLDVQQNMSGDDILFRIVDLLKNGISITVSMLNSDGGVGSFVSFEATLIKHSFKLDYGCSTEIATHVLEFNEVHMF